MGLAAGTDLALMPAMTSSAPLALILALVSASAPARASAEVDAQASSSTSRRTAVGVDLGVASAVGVAGVTLTRAFTDQARLEGGVGYGLSGLQLSLMPKWVFGRGRDHFVTGVGLAIAFPGDSRSASGHPLWLNVDVAGYEHRFDSGLAVSAAVGLTGGLGGGRLCVPADGCEPQFLHDVTTYWGPQGRVGVAYWF